MTKSNSSSSIDDSVKEAPAKEDQQLQSTTDTKSSSKRKIAIIIAVVIILIAAIGAGAWYLIDQHNKEVWEQEHKTYPVNISILFEGYDPETSSPIPVLIGGTDFEGNSVSIEALVGNTDSEQISLMRGNYTISVSTSPFLADGTMFDVSASEGEFEVVGDGETGQGNVSLTMTQLNPSDLTEENIVAAKDKLVSLGFNENTANQYADAALNQVNEVKLASQMADAKARFTAELEQLNSEFENDPRRAGTQMEMNTSAAEYHQKYDALVEDIYSYLTTVLTSNELASLESSQTSWEAEKEAGSQAAGERSIGGTMHPLDVNTAAMDYDKERINELLEMMG